MKSASLTVKLVGLGVILGLGGIILGGLAVKAPAADPKTRSDFVLSAPYTHKNLTILLIHGKRPADPGPYLTLQEAMESGKVIVHETSNVGQLAIENLSETQEVFVQAGDIVKGGKQDRVLVTDLIVPSRSGRVSIASFCVERGRWKKRGEEAVSRFSRSNSFLSTKDLKLAARYRKTQDAVWKSVSRTQAKLAASLDAPALSAQSPSSLQLTLENRELHAGLQEYLEKLSGILDGKSRVTGLALAINGRINSAEIYRSTALFQKLWPKLLRASVIEAIAESLQGASFQAVNPGKVSLFLEEANRGALSQRRVSGSIQSVTRETDTTLLFETRHRDQDDGWIHRSYLSK